MCNPYMYVSERSIKSCQSRSIKTNSEEDTSSKHFNYYGATIMSNFFFKVIASLLVSTTSAQNCQIYPFDANALDPNEVLPLPITVTLKEPIEIFLTEGSIRRIDIPTRTLYAMGRNVSFPITECNPGAGRDGPVDNLLGMTAQYEVNAAVVSPIKASNMRLVLDSSVNKPGWPLRSLCGTMQPDCQGDSLNSSFLVSMTDDIREHYTNLGKFAFSMYPWNTEKGLRPDAGVFDSQSKTFKDEYPELPGATLITASSIYVDEAIPPREYVIPDADLRLEFSENVAGGIVTAITDPLTSVFLTSSLGLQYSYNTFALGDLIAVINEDPRTPLHILGGPNGRTPLPLDHFMSEAYRLLRIVNMDSSLFPVPTPEDRAAAAVALSNTVVIGYHLGGSIIIVQDISCHFDNPPGFVDINPPKFSIVKKTSGSFRMVGDISGFAKVTYASFTLINANGSFILTDRLFTFDATGAFDARVQKINLSALARIEININYDTPTVTMTKKWTVDAAGNAALEVTE